MPGEVFVLVPSYNHAAYVEECLRSIFAQTLQPKKLLVIDDGSSDGSVAIIRRVLEECPFDAELIARENRGLCNTLNEGSSGAHFEFFAYLGSDDKWSPDFLAERVRLLASRPKAVLAYGNAVIIDGTGRITDRTADHAEVQSEYSDGDPRKMLLRGTAPVSSTVVYRRAALDGLRWNQEARLEDYEFYLRLMSRGDFLFDPATLSHWRRHSANTSRDRQMMLDEIVAAIARNCDDLDLAEDQIETYAAAVRFRYARIALQEGDRAGAWRLARNSFSGARSFVEIGGFLARLLLPMSIVNRRRSLRINT